MIDFIKLDASSLAPKYLQIIDSIIYNISVGNAKIGDKIPSINKLSKEFYLSRDTVERAYSVLKKRKVVVCVPGKGTYITKNQIISKLNVLFLVNKLSPFQMSVYNSFVEKMGENCYVDIHSYHSDETLFLELMQKYESSYDYYVIMPHFRTKDLSHTSFTKKITKVLHKIPKEDIILLDNGMHGLDNNFAEVYQDYKNDIIIALDKGKEKISEYNKITMVYPKTSFYPYPKDILYGFENFCSQNNFKFEIIEEITDEVELKNKNLFITLEESDLVNLVNKVRKSNYTLGKDIGVISYNDTPLKQLLGITVLTTDFNIIGLEAAKMIIENKKEKVKAPFNFIERESM